MSVGKWRENQLNGKVLKTVLFCKKLLKQILKCSNKKLIAPSLVSASQTTARGLVPSYPWEVPLRLGLESLFYSLKVPLKLI